MLSPSFSIISEFEREWQDLMASFGGGERVGEAALRQILKTVSTSPPEKPINGTLGDNDNDGGDGVPRQV